MLGTEVFNGVTTSITSTRLSALIVKGTLAAEHDWLDPVMLQLTAVLAMSVVGVKKVAGSKVRNVPTRSVNVSVVPLSVWGVSMLTPNLVTLHWFGTSVSLVELNK